MEMASGKDKRGAELEFGRSFWIAGVKPGRFFKDTDKD